MQINIYKDKMLGARLFGASVLYSAAPIPREDVPQGWYCYDLRGTARHPDEPHALVDLAIHWDGREWLSEDRLRMDEFKDDPVVAEAAAHLRQVLDESPAVGRVTFASGERWNYTDPQKYLQTVREELPCHATTGFRCETLTDDPAVRKAVDDMLCDLYGEENPRQIEDYDGTGMTMGV